MLKMFRAWERVWDALELTGAVWAARALRAVDGAGWGVVVGSDIAAVAFCCVAVLGDIGITVTPRRDRLHARACYWGRIPRS